MRTLYRIIKFAVTSFKRNIWLSLVTISIITLTLVSVNFFVLFNALVDTSLQAIEQRVSVTVNFKNTVQENEMLAMKSRLESLAPVASVEYISKQDALDNLKKKYQQENNTSITDALNELESNPLFGSLVIKAKTVDQYPAILQALDSPDNASLVETKSYEDRQALIDKIAHIKNRISQIGWILNVFFALITALIVFNTIRITIYTRQEEISIMKLVGATNWFVTAPLILESVLYSLVALAVTIALIYPLLGVLQPYSDKIFDGQAFDVLGFFSHNFLMIFGYQLLASVVLNVISSSIAIIRYLKV